MFRHILIPLDGSPLAEQALPLSKIFALRFSSAVTLLRVIEPSANLAINNTNIQTAREYLDTVRQKFIPGINVTCEIKSGTPARVILDLAANTPFDLVAIATHGRTAPRQWVYGSVADKVVSGAHLPILLVRPNREHRTLTQVKRILIPLDGSPLAELSLEPARQFAQTFDAELVLFRAVESFVYATQGLGGSVIAQVDEEESRTAQAYVMEKAQALYRQGIRVSVHTEYGIIPEEIIDTAHKRRVDLIVMSTHGHSGLGRWVMGSVADRVLRSSPTPVLLLRANMHTS